MSFYDEESPYERLSLENALKEASFNGWVSELERENPRIPEEYTDTAEYNASD